MRRRSIDHAVHQYILAQLDGLTDAQLRSAVLPSGWSPLGLVRHLTLSDERYWFEVVMAGGPLDFWPEGHNGDWTVGDHEPSEHDRGLPHGCRDLGRA
ncbi:MAG: DUF664 domain-containing protein [Micropruina glycogenica]